MDMTNKPCVLTECINNQDGKCRNDIVKSKWCENIKHFGNGDTIMTKDGLFWRKEYFSKPKKIVMELNDDETYQVKIDYDLSDNNENLNVNIDKAYISNMIFDNKHIQLDMNFINSIKPNDKYEIFSIIMEDNKIHTDKLITYDNMERSNFICSRCNKQHLYKDISMVLASNPPKYKYTCPNCGNIEYHEC